MRKLAAFAASFSAAVFAWAYGALPLLALLAVPALRRREDRRLRCALVCAGAAAGLLWSWGYGVLFLAPARALAGTYAGLTGAVAGWPYETAYGAAVDVRVEPASGPAFLARLYGEPELLEAVPGDQISATAACRTSEVVRGQLSGDYTAQGIYLLAYAQGAAEVVRPERIPLWDIPAHWARALEEAAASAFPADAAGLVTALLTGNKDGLTETEYAALQRTGLAHAVAVSGLHIGFLAQLAVALAGSRYRRRAALLALPVMAVYVLVTGCTPSVIRSAIMNALVLLGPLLDRESDSPTSLSFALMVLLMQNPFACQSVGLQLSFASVAGILAFSGRISGALTAHLPKAGRGKGLRPRLLGLLRGAAVSLGTTVGATAFTLPLGAWYFGTVSLVAPAANLLCLFLVQLTFQAGLAAALLALVLPGPAQLLGNLLAFLPRLVLFLARSLSRVPFAALAIDGPYLLGGAAALYLLWLCFLSIRGSKRPLVPLCCSAVVISAALVLHHAAYRMGPVTLTALDVGQGQCVALRAGDRVALVDCGGSARRNAGDLAADYLGTVGVDRVDLLILTHYHADHANGVLELLARMEVSALAVPDVDREDALRQELLAAAEDHGVQVWFVSDDQRLSFGPAELTLYAPLGAGDANEAGLSVLFQGAGFSALLTGDMGEDIEARLVKYGNLPDIDLLVAGHHGSRSAASQLLLETVTPEAAVISCGYNTYGHPAPETLGRLAAAGCDIYRTDQQGNLTVTVRGTS